MGESKQFDAVVLGGGPAGATIATELARLGRAVAFISAPQLLAGLEGISPKLVEFLNVRGASSVVDACELPVVREVCWNGESSASNQEVLINRSAFDAGLRLEACKANATQYRGKVVVVRQQDEEWQVELSDGSILRAPFLAEARGRRAPRSGKNLWRGPQAIAACWPLAAGGQPGTAITSFEDGWVWAALNRQGRGHLQVLVGGDFFCEHGKEGLVSLLGRISGLAGVSKLLRSCEQIRSKIGYCRDASSYLIDEPISPNSIRVGDAALGVDPLSGSGIYYAISGALSAAAAVNTLLMDSSKFELVRRFYTSRARAMYRSQVSTAQYHYCLENWFSDHPFWQGRQSFEIPEDGYVGGSPLGICEMPVVENGEVGLRRVIRTERHPDGVFTVSGQQVVPLYQRIAEGASAVKLAGSDERCKAAIAWMVNDGVLTPDGDVVHFRDNDNRRQDAESANPDQK